MNKIKNSAAKVSVSIWALFGILIGLFVITSLIDPYFFSIPSVGITLQLAAPLGLLAAGQTICMLTGGIDLSIAMIATGAHLSSVLNLHPELFLPLHGQLFIASLLAQLMVLPSDYLA